MFAVPSHCRMYEYFIRPFCGRVVFHGVAVPDLCIHSALGGHVGWLSFLAIMSNAAVTIVCRVLCRRVFVSLGEVPRRLLKLLEP